MKRIIITQMKGIMAKAEEQLEHIKANTWPLKGTVVCSHFLQDVLGFPFTIAVKHVPNEAAGWILDVDVDITAFEL